MIISKIINNRGSNSPFSCYGFARELFLSLQTTLPTSQGQECEFGPLGNKHQSRRCWRWKVWSCWPSVVGIKFYLPEMGIMTLFTFSLTLFTRHICPWLPHRVTQLHDNPSIQLCYTNTYNETSDIKWELEIHWINCDQSAAAPTGSTETAAALGMVINVPVTIWSAICILDIDPAIRARVALAVTPRIPWVSFKHVLTVHFLKSNSDRPCECYRMYPGESDWWTDSASNELSEVMVWNVPLA